VNNLESFGPGDQILFRGGDVFAGGLAITLAGSSNSPCRLGSYGSRSATLTDVAPNTSPICQLINSEYFSVSNLNFIGTLGNNYPGTDFIPVNKGTGLAITFTRQSGHRFKSILIKDCLFEDTCRGLWISCESSSKVAGCDGVTIKGCQFDSVYQFGCYVIGYNILQSGPVDQFLNVCVSSNQFRHIYGDPHFASEAQALSVSGATGIVIEGNLFGDNCGYGGYYAGTPFGGSSAFGVSNCRDFRIQGNEVYGTKCVRPFDGNAIDMDQDSQNGEVCYNLTYNNAGPSIQLGSFGGATNRNIAIHNNISYDDVRGCQINSVQGALRDWGNTDEIQFYNNSVYVDKAGTIGTPSCYSEEVGNNTHISVLNNIFKTTQGVPMIRPNGSTAADYNPCHINSSSRFIGNCYDSSGSPLIISSDNTHGLYMNITTLAAWQNLGQESLSSTLCGIVADAGFKGLDSFKPPNGSFLTNRQVGMVRNFDLTSDSMCRGRAKDIMRFVTIQPPLAIQRMDYHGNLLPAADIGAVQTSVR